ncbi:hypothetical protein Val02_90500 [Virgisporangium aliadipatigenens]|uniref:Uncharacterized protein n=1 Tax=Virgisporangium aliadipatigenens TaxID=741659 RepID=A0A8J4DVU0_9ACTN|nr:hypothetical protein [Virgisporangium aliadipatigenens]GIJ52164.1 hypothetical protein Val02_90500 [Virgisporangium aliadipatigenens]
MSELDATADRPGGRSTTFVVVLALVFLTVLGASVGVILAKSKGAGDSNTGAPPFDAASSAPPQATAGASKAPGGGSSGGGYPAAVKDQCPKQTRDATGIANLIAVRSIVTDKSEAWICKSPDNKLFYQGHRRGKPFTAAMSNDSICLSDVTRDGDAYVATNVGNDGATTKYYVGHDYLRITINGRDDSNERAIDRWGD